MTSNRTGAHFFLLFLSSLVALVALTCSAPQLTPRTPVRLPLTATLLVTEMPSLKSTPLPFLTTDNHMVPTVSAVCPASPIATPESLPPFHPEQLIPGSPVPGGDYPPCPLSPMDSR
jgi:hypothetical protein